jgi:hypothetical protein
MAGQGVSSAQRASVESCRVHLHASPKVGGLTPTWPSPTEGSPAKSSGLTLRSFWLQRSLDGRSFNVEAKFTQLPRWLNRTECVSALLGIIAS